MSDWLEDTRALKEINKAERRERAAKNRAAIDAAGIPYTERPSSLLFREPGRPRVDFFPSTGRWRVAGVRRTFRGGAGAFLAWYAKQASA